MTKNLTAANQLTILRMLLIPAFVILMMYGYRGWALVTFLTAGVTDMLDGLIARSTGQNTELGAWLDPMADKLLLVTMFIVLTLPGIGSANQLPLWFTVLVISRDVAIVGTVAVFNLAVGPRTFRPSVFGKIATATYIFTGVITLYFNYLGQPTRVVTAFIYASLVITFISAGHYLFQVFRLANSGEAPSRGA
ncbi:MAG: CDP-alcohol phosphatidyltransferase family protein [Acidobacteria bacterium]|nr:CDP-alcohol phosphatidyltransferase family protein [Acidobacteriota bacterium]